MVEQAVQHCQMAISCFENCSELVTAARVGQLLVAALCQHGYSDARVEDEVTNYRVSHITGPTFFLPFSRLLEHIQRNFS